jgi:hypothetical protein
MITQTDSALLETITPDRVLNFFAHATLFRIDFGAKHAKSMNEPIQVYENKECPC